MNISKKIVITLFLVVSLIFSFAVFAFADEKCVVKYGDSDFSLSEDLFPNLNNIMPGDKKTRRIIFQNDNTKSIKAYFRGYTKEQSEDATKLLSVLKLNVVVDGKTVYNDYMSNISSMGNTNKNTTNYFLVGKLHKGDNSVIDVTVTLEGAQITNDFADLKAILTWEFAAEQVSSGSNSRPHHKHDRDEKEKSNITNKSNTTVVTSTIYEEVETKNIVEVPNDEIIIIDEDVPLASLPLTGGKTNIQVLTIGIVTIISGFILLTISIVRKRTH